MAFAIPGPSIRPAKRLAFRIALAIMLVQAAIFVTAGFAYLAWFETDLATRTEEKILGPGRLIQTDQLSYAAIANRTRMQEIVGAGLIDALLVGANGNVFHALDPALVGRQVGSLPGIDPGWFRAASTSPLLTRHVIDGHPYLVGITPLITFENIAPFLYVYVRFDATATDHELKQMRIAVIAAVLFAILMTTIVIYAVFELLLFRRIRRALKTLGNETAGGEHAEPPQSTDEISLVEIGVRRMAADRARERSLRAVAETALIEVQAKEVASTAAARQAEQEARHARALIDAVPDGLITIDQDGTVLTCNEVAAQRLGEIPEAVVGRGLHAFVRRIETRTADAPALDGNDALEWPQVGTHSARICTTGEEVEIVVIRADAPDHHRAIFLRRAVDDEVQHELARLGACIGHDLQLTPGQWQSVGERVAMLRDYVIALESERRMVSSALDAIPMAVVVVNQGATVRYANKLAEHMLGLKDGLLILQGRLTAAGSNDNGQLRGRIAEIAAGSAEAGAPPWAAMRIERDDGMAWFIRIAPLDPPAQPATGGNLVIVLISDPSLPVKPSISMLRQLHGLTYAEADILGRLTMGMRLQEIADELGVSVETVRTHLKAIFTKTGTSRQAELVRHAILSGAILTGDDAGNASNAPSPGAAIRGGEAAAAQQALSHHTTRASPK